MQTDSIFLKTRAKATQTEVAIGTTRFSKACMRKLDFATGSHGKNKEAEATTSA
jgi:hypothetical protein